MKATQQVDPTDSNVFNKKSIMESTAKGSCKLNQSSNLTIVSRKKTDRRILASFDYINASHSSIKNKEDNDLKKARSFLSSGSRTPNKNKRQCRLFKDNYTSRLSRKQQKKKSFNDLIKTEILNSSKISHSDFKSHMKKNKNQSSRRNLIKILHERFDQIELSSESLDKEELIHCLKMLLEENNILQSKQGEFKNSLNELNTKYNELLEKNEANDFESKEKMIEQEKKIQQQGEEIDDLIAQNEQLCQKLSIAKRDKQLLRNLSLKKDTKIKCFEEKYGVLETSRSSLGCQTNNRSDSNSIGHSLETHSIFSPSVNFFNVESPSRNSKLLKNSHVEFNRIDKENQNQSPQVKLGNDQSITLLQKNRNDEILKTLIDSIKDDFIQRESFIRDKIVILVLISRMNYRKN